MVVNASLTINKRQCRALVTGFFALYVTTWVVELMLHRFIFKIQRGKRKPMMNVQTIQTVVKDWRYDDFECVVSRAWFTTVEPVAMAHHLQDGCSKTSCAISSSAAKSPSLSFWIDHSINNSRPFSLLAKTTWMDDYVGAAKKTKEQHRNPSIVTCVFLHVSSQFYNQKIFSDDDRWRMAR